MNKYRVQATVSLETAVEVKAASLEEAIEIARKMEADDPVHAGFVSIPRKVEYMWNNGTKLTGVIS